MIKRFKVSRSVIRRVQDLLTEENILEVRGKIGYYVKNVSPLYRKIIKRKNKLIGIILPQLSDFYYSSFVNGIGYVTDTKNLITMNGNSHGNFEREKNLIVSFIKNGVDGLILFPYKDNVGQDYIDQLDKYKLPCILTHCPDDLKANTININNYHGSRTAVNYLIKNGHKRIALLSDIHYKDFWFIRERVRGYEQAFNDNKITPIQDLVYLDNNAFDPATLAVTVKDILAKKATAVFCLTDGIAYRFKFSLPKDEDPGPG